MGMVITPLRLFRRPQITTPRYARGLLDYPGGITVSGLTATPGLGQVTLAWSVLDPNSYIAAVEIWMAKSNDRTQANNYGDALTPFTSFTHIVTSQGGSNYYWIRARDLSGSVGAWFPTSPTGGVQSTANNVPNVPGLNFNLINGSIVASVSAGALTIAVKTATGGDPSPSDPVFVVFPNIATGAYQVRPIITALSLTITSGSTMGLLATSLSVKLWVELFDDAGTLRLGVTLRSYQGGSVLPLFDGGVATTVAEGGAGGADGTLIYTDVAVTSKTYRLLGYVEWSSGLAALGTWTAPDVVRLAAQGVRPGAVVQEYFAQIASIDGGTQLIPWDTTIPQKTEGVNWTGAMALTPSAASNWFEVDVLVNVAHSVPSEVICAVFRDSESDAIGVGVGYVAAANEPTQVRVNFRVLANGVATRNFAVRVGGANAGTLSINGSVSATMLGYTLYSHVLIKEIWG